MILATSALTNLVRRHRWTDVEDHLIGPASVDLTLSRHYLKPRSKRHWRTHTAGLSDGANWEQHTAVGAITLGAGDFLLCQTVQRVAIPLDRCGVVAGKSSRAREGLIVESAGFVDPGFGLAEPNSITLEITNIGARTIKLPVGIPIAQIVVMCLLGETEGYSGRYVYQQLPTTAGMEGGPYVRD